MRVVLHVAHRHQAIDARDAEPVQHVRHQLLEAHVLHAGDALGAREVGRGAVAALLALARVVDQELGDLAERAAFLAVVDDQADAAVLRGRDALLDAVRQVRPAGADVGAEHVGAVALVVHAAGELARRIGERGEIAEDVDGLAADRRQEHLEVGPGDQLREHAAGLLEQRAAQVALGDAEALGDAGQVPDRLDRGLGAATSPVAVSTRPSGSSSPEADRVLDLGQSMCALVTAMVGRMS